MSQLVGPGAIGLAGNTSDIWTTPFPHRPGDKARDKAGNEYVFVSFITTNVSGGLLVSINDRYEAAPLLGTTLKASRVGVAMTGATFSTNGGWVQIYGTHLGVQTFGASDGLASDGTVGYFCIPQTSVGTPSGTLSLIIADSSVNQNLIYGMWLSDLASVSAFVAEPGGFAVPTSGTSGPSTDLVTGTTNGTSMHSGQTYVVFLNYPFVTGITNGVVQTSNS